MAKYNGHKNWNHWNVALWIGNDEGLYNEARHLIQTCHTRDEAARALLTQLAARGITKTADGAPYTFSSVRAALRGL